VIPRGGGEGDLTALAQRQGQHGHDGEHGQEDRRGPRDRQVGPLPLGLQAKMCPGLFSRDLHRPAPDDPLEDLRGAKTRMMASGTGGMSCPPSIA
jgi:hypothetical protein